MPFPLAPVLLAAVYSLAQGTFQTPQKFQQQLFDIYILHSARLFDCHGLIFSS